MFFQSQRRERLLTRRVHLKEQQIQDYSNQINELKSSVQTPVRSLLDPAVRSLYSLVVVCKTHESYFSF